MRLLTLFLFFTLTLHAQDKSDTTDTTSPHKLDVEVYIDSYYAYDFNKPSDHNRPYAVSMSRHNEPTVNLAYVSLKYSSPRVRARFVPGVGTYMNANYASEPWLLRYIVEANAGIKISKSKSIWLDFGVLRSPYTNETPISRDHLTYTRSFAPEFVPYYLAGVKLSIPLTDRLDAYIYIVNGWQQIQDVNSSKSIGTHLEFRPNDNWVLNWVTYAGNENSAIFTKYSNRYFTDAYFIYTKGKWSATGCAYVGMQEGTRPDAYWWQANLVGSYNITSIVSVAARAEYFHDDDGIMARPQANPPGFRCYSGSLGLNIRPIENFLLRAEYRKYYSPRDIFRRDQSAVNTNTLLTAGITWWF